MVTATGTFGESVASRAGLVLWWLALAVCALYGAYALSMGTLAVLSLLDLVQDAPRRGAPLLFVVHAWSGGIALISGVVQFNGGMRRRWPRVHRALGRVYVVSVWIAGLAGLEITPSIEASLATKAGFAVLAVLWFATTTVALLRIRSRRVAAHRVWMIRSFALSLFFVTFGTWAPGAASIRDSASYTLGVWLSWMLNLLIAEVWIRRASFLSRLPRVRRQGELATA
jgi:uncharacterized membrane protein